ncbi:hypothetical protein GCM10011579_038180 [Streptomyces albiflavescens]|uniref:Uncharacterized protein n=1 Tax=Streptomyces albiflavescens TaxID=1623582 RepID=A0A917Y433_9ACTN|nr:hypothetical protein GCM10011579_038180 [Streptomyces albiflavescens]
MTEMPSDSIGDSVSDGHYPITPRRVSFDWEETPLHRIPDEPTATHLTTPGSPGARYSLAAHNRSVRKGLLPTWRELGAAIPRYLRGSYHPSQEGSLRRAVEYPAQSPAARSAAGAIGRAAIA